EINDDLSNIDLQDCRKILTRLLKYPPSQIKDASLCQMIEDVRTQSRNFETLTKSSTLNSSKMAQTAKYIIADLQKFQHGELDLADTLASTEVRVTKIMEKCHLLMNDYDKIANSFYRISKDLRVQNSKIQLMLHEIKTKELNDRIKAAKKGSLTGLGIGTLTAIPVAICISPVDSGVTLATTLITGGIIGLALEKSGNENDRKLGYQKKILQEDQKFIESVVNDIEEFQRNVKIFENLWQQYHDRISEIRKMGFTSQEIPHSWDGPAIQSMWTQVKNAFENYSCNVILDS
ncbi:942_t:CDS:1, partial [Acaulospora morrowiae]